jgi:hypothetical protein
VDGERVNLDGLAETIRAGRMRIDARVEHAAIPVSERGQDLGRGAGRLLSRAHQEGKRAGGMDARPGQYPLGSPQSRAAARSLLAARRAIQGEGTLIQLIAVGPLTQPDRKCTCPVPEAGTIAICRCFCEAG